MNIEFVKKWIAALRRGEYKQGRYKLKRDGEFCCLGVLCDLHDCSRWCYDDEYSKLDGSSVRSFPPYDIIDQLRGNVIDVKIGDCNYCLAYLNDHRKFTFSEIADAVEADWINNEPLKSHPKLP